MRFALCNELYGMLSVGEVITRAAALGYDGLELAPFTLCDDLWAYPVSAQREIARIASGCGVELMGLHWLLRGQEGLGVTSGDPATRRRTADFLRKLLEVASNTGARILTLGSPAQRSFVSPDTHGHAAERFTDLLRPLLADFESAGVVLSVEPLETEYTNFITSTAEARALADSLGSRAVGITLDTHFLRWEAAAGGVDIPAAFALAGDRLEHVHIQDDNRRAPSMGAWDFTELFATLRHIGWDGYVSLETFVAEDLGEADAIARRGIDFLQDVEVG